MELPAIIVIPGIGGSLGLGMNEVRESAKRAIGADILYKVHQIVVTGFFKHREALVHIALAKHAMRRILQYGSRAVALKGEFPTSAGGSSW